MSGCNCQGEHDGYCSLGIDIGTDLNRETPRDYAGMRWLLVDYIDGQDALSGAPWTYENAIGGEL